MTFANSMELDQAHKKCQAWSGSKLFDILIGFLKEFLKKKNFEKNQQPTRECKITQHAKSKKKIDTAVIL